MKTYLINKPSYEYSLCRIDIFSCCDIYYWSYHNEVTVYKTVFNSNAHSELTKYLPIEVITHLCKNYNWEFIGEVE